MLCGVIDKASIGNSSLGEHCPFAAHIPTCSCSPLLFLNLILSNSISLLLSLVFSYSFLLCTFLLFTIRFHFPLLFLILSFASLTCVSSLSSCNCHPCTHLLLHFSIIVINFVTNLPYILTLHFTHSLLPLFSSLFSLQVSFTLCTNCMAQN